eukprot:GHVQ01024470.1.p1 GENE.GHVQ01024470.1~~GHVQ01024470.1.p1  ORF type:complete len:890 (-),score=136.23 GHVQ01024470.1:368-3037(-)
MAEVDVEPFESLESSAFEALEKDFQEVLQELVGDKSLEHFRLEYEKLHRALRKSHESEKRLIKKCRELNGEIVSNAAKVQTALRLSQDDQSTISALKKEIERAWKMVEASHEKEQRAKETIQNLKVEISNLGKLVEQGAGLTINQENAVNDLIKQKDELIKERDLLSQTVAQLSTQNSELFENVQDLESRKAQGESEIQGLRELLQTKKTEAEREQRRKERLDKELKELRQTLEQRHAELKIKQTQMQQEKETIGKLEAQLSDLKKLQEIESRQHVELNNKISDAETRLNEQIARNSKLAAENAEKDREIKQKKDEMNNLCSEKDGMHRLHEALKKKYEQLENDRKEVDDQRKSRFSVVVEQKCSAKTTFCHDDTLLELKNEVQAIIRDIDNLKKQAEADRKSIEDLLRERDILNKNVIKAGTNTKQQVDLVKRHETQAVHLNKDIQRYKEDAQSMKKRIYALEKNREKYGMELSQSNAKYIGCLEELKNRDNKLSEMTKSIGDLKSRLSQQKTLYEAVRTDRNLYSKNLIESQDEISEMKRKFKIMYHQIEQLKEEMKDKDSGLVKEHSERQKLAKDNDKIKEDVQKSKKRVVSLNQIVENQMQEIKKLESTIQEAEQEKQNQKKEYDGVISERDILGTQLIRRNDELSLLYEKIKIQQSTLQKGELQYKERLEDIRALRRKIGTLKAELRNAKLQVANIEELKREVYHLQKDLLQERTKVTALSEELENPINVHRWRKLEGSDPATYEMIQKIQTLQKRLITKTEEVVEKDLLIQEREKLYVELKGILARQPGPEIAEQLQIYQQTLKDKTKQLKSMASELNMYHCRMTDYKDEIERLTKELQEIRRKYFEQRRREQAQKDRVEMTVHMNPSLNQPRFAGGGFNLAA